MPLQEGLAFIWRFTYMQLCVGVIRGDAAREFWIKMCAGLHLDSDARHWTYVPARPLARNMVSAATAPLPLPLATLQLVFRSLPRIDEVAGSS